MRKIVLAALFAVIIVPVYGQIKMTYTYESVDTWNNPITLSMAVLFPSSRCEIKRVMLESHPTCTDNGSVCSQPGIVSTLMTYLLGRAAKQDDEPTIVVIPDYLGYGETVALTHPYCSWTLTARNEMDALLYILRRMKNGEVPGYTLAPDYYTTAGGASQGGGNSLAFLRYLDTYATESVRKAINLRHVVAVSGPFDLNYTYMDMAEQEALSLPFAIPLTIDGMCATYQEGCLHEWSENNDVFYSNRMLNNSVLKLLRDTKKSTGMKKIVAQMEEEELINTDSILSDSCINNPSCAPFRAIIKALKKNNLFAPNDSGGYWKPSVKTLFMSGPSDNIVPFGNTEEAMDYYEQYADSGYYAFAHPDSLIDVVYKQYDSNTKEHKSGYDGLKLVGMMSNVLKTTSDEWVHEDYCMAYFGLCGDSIFRNILPYGEALEHDTLPMPDIVEPTVLIIADGDSILGDTCISRIDIASEIVKDQWYMMRLPANLDGYYFGPDARRYLLIPDDGERNEGTNGIVCDTIAVAGYRPEGMDDQDDFEAWNTYLVRSNIDCSSFCILTPGIDTAVKGSDELVMFAEVHGDLETYIEECMRNKIEPIKERPASGRAYNAVGQRITSSYRGLVIINGRKMICR